MKPGHGSVDATQGLEEVWAEPIDAKICVRENATLSASATSCGRSWKTLELF